MSKLFYRINKQAVINKQQHKSMEFIYVGNCLCLEMRKEDKGKILGGEQTRKTAVNFYPKHHQFIRDFSSW